MATDLYNTFLQQAKKNVGPSSYQQTTTINGRPMSGENSYLGMGRMKTGTPGTTTQTLRGSEGDTRTVRTTTSPVYNRSKIANNIMGQYGTYQQEQTNALHERIKQQRAAMDAERKTAVDAYNERVASSAAAARAASQMPTFDAASLAPLQAITSVALTPTGGQSAAPAMYLPPENTQSQFTLGAPTGSLTSGQRPSTGAVTSVTNDDLNKRYSGSF